MAELDTIDIERKDLKIVKSIFARHLPYKQVWAYGSRVKWTATHTSDLDCVVFGATDSEIANTKEALDESDIPFEVQLLNWETIPPDFRENIRGQYFVLQNKLDWKKTTLGDHINIKHGYAFKGNYITTNISNDILVTPGNFYIGGGFKHDKFKYFHFAYPKNYILKKNDIVLTMTDLSKEGDTLGYAAKVPEIKGKNFLHNQRIGLVEFLSKNVDKNFIYWLMRTKDYQGFIVGAASGTSIRHTSPTSIKEYSFLLPPLPEQKAIASVLSNLDDKIDLLHRQNKTLESIAETLFRQWFIEEAQDDWEEVKLGDFIAPKKGKNITKSQAIDGQYPVIAGGLNPSCYHNQCNTSAPVITISASGANAGFVNLHYIPVWSSDSSFIDSTTTNDVYFFYMFLKYFQEGIYDKQEGSAQPHIYSGHLINLDILKYPLVLIENYEINVTPFFNKIAKNQKQIKTLESLRDTLLPKLMSGDVRVEYEDAT